MSITRRRIIPALATVAAIVAVPLGVTSAGTLPPTEPAPFAIPADRFGELEAAGLGWMAERVDYPGQPAGVPWPGGEWATGELPAGADADALEAMLNDALAPSEGSSCCIDAIIAVQGGQVVVERYREGWDPATPHESWSMAKSITQALIGILVAQGRLDPFAPAPVEEWADTADPRHAITIDNLLHMRSGLEWQEEYEGRSDVVEMLFGEGRANRAHFAADRPLVADPDTLWSYSTGTTNILSRIIADQVGYGDDSTQWARDVLFDRLGIGVVEHDLDGIGVMSAGSTFRMTALDFARFGLLYLRGGEWDGEQIVPTEWVDYARLPFPDAPEYGAHWWTAGSEDGFRNAFQANGFNGQSITVVPELDLVVVVLANEEGARPDLVAAGVIAAFDDAA